MAAKKFVVRFDEISSKDGAQVGGKNAALGEMVRALKARGVRIPGGFATTADAFRLFVRENKIHEKIRAEIEGVKKGTKSLAASGKCYASLFTDRAINYREERNLNHLKIALSAGVQKMVRADKAGAGVMFSIDTESGFPRVVRISAAWGLGEAIVQGAVNPDEYMIFKPLLGSRNVQPILEKSLGDKKCKVVYVRNGRGTPTINTSKKERESFTLGDAEILRLARWA